MYSSVNMNHELLCTWLGLPKTAWPPDVWTLLGLPRAAEHDLPTIEQAACRTAPASCCSCYQPFPGRKRAEGMNRLGRGVCHADGNQRQAPGRRTDQAGARPTNGGAADLRRDVRQLRRSRPKWSGAGRAAAGPRRNRGNSGDSRGAGGSRRKRCSLSQPFVALPASRDIAAKSIGPELRELAAESSDEATSNLRTLHAVILRIEMTRHLLTAWDKLGKHLHATPKKRARESEQFSKRLEEIGEAMPEYPAILGLPGKPGYRVLVLARLKMPLLIARAMPEEQRTGSAVRLESRPADPIDSPQVSAQALQVDAASHNRRVGFALHSLGAERLPVAHAARRLHFGGSDLGGGCEVALVNAEFGVRPHGGS